MAYKFRLLENNISQDGILTVLSVVISTVVYRKISCNNGSGFGGLSGASAVGSSDGLIILSWNKVNVSCL